MLAANKNPVLPGKIYDQKMIHLLFGTCWATYFISYLGRLNYAASMVEIGNDMGYTASMLGLIATIMFISYGAGQLVGGIIGDHLSPRVMVLCGTGISAVCNILAGLTNSFVPLAVIWGINGLAQSLIWSPILRLFSMYMPEQTMYKACVNIQSSCAVGTCATYLLASGLIAITSWRAIFFVSGFMLIAVVIWWQIAISRVEAFAKKFGRVEQPFVEEENPAKNTTSIWKLFMASGLFATLIPVIAMGILRDGVMTWMPEYAVGNFGASTTFSIFLTAFLPFINLSGVYIITPIRKKIQNEQLMGAIMFAVGGLAAAALVFFKGNLVLTIILFAIVTSCMTGCNTALISLMPTFFVRWNRTSSASGVLNAFCYAGSALSGYGIGLIAEKAGWGAVQIFWLIVAALGFIICLVLAPVWQKFKNKSM